MKVAQQRQRSGDTKQTSISPIPSHFDLRYSTNMPGNFLPCLSRRNLGYILLRLRAQLFKSIKIFPHSVHIIFRLYCYPFLCYSFSSFSLSTINHPCTPAKQTQRMATTNRSLRNISKVKIYYLDTFYLEIKRET